MSYPPPPHGSGNSTGPVNPGYQGNPGNVGGYATPTPQHGQPVQGNGPYPQQGWQQPPPAPPTPPGDSGDGKGFKRVVIGLVVVAVLAVFGVGGLALYQTLGGASMSATDESGGEEIVSDEEIASLLVGRTKALAGGDEEEYLAPFTGKAKDTQRKIFKNLRKLPLEEAKYKVIKQTGSGTDEYGSDDVSVSLDIAFVHQIKGVDVRPVSEWYRWTISKETADDEPRITEVGGSPSAYGTKSAVFYPAPWDVYDDMYVKRGQNSIIIGDKKNSASIGRYAPIVDRAAKSDLSLWKSKGPGTENTPNSFLVILEPDRKKYIELYNASKDDVGYDAGQSVPMPAFNENFRGGKDEKLDYGGARIKIDTSSTQFKGSAWKRGVAAVSRHEIAHALVQPLDLGTYTAFGPGDNSVRTWVAEGFGEYFGLRGDREYAEWSVKSGTEDLNFDGKLPDDDFEMANSVGANYALSYLAIKFIADKAGEEAALGFVAAHYQKPKNIDQQLQNATGMGKQEFEAAWAEYVRSKL
ncbi:hypothetical protein QIS99_19170 [Streptomyces sp. B-S-A8]|uniref:Peptidase MA-like domain-containing protein n=1 Tax=Streptomyces solicavernae TaxID=3043614 RepID=A0ABT6RV41_9ACTN|nr:hypothetical protein [Streptomyces sp. B-S-A8]MDI3388308.1 hypothetical protein [Streptomyces sp. B-S-A8]